MFLPLFVLIIRILFLIGRYHDGYRAEGLTDKDINMSRLFYPAWWLKISGYFDSKINTGDGVIMFAPSPYLISGGYGWILALFLTALISSVLSLTVAYIVTRRSKYMSWNGSGYGSASIEEREGSSATSRSPLAPAPGRALTSSSNYSMVGV